MGTRIRVSELATRGMSRASQNHGKVLLTHQPIHGSVIRTEAEGFSEHAQSTSDALPVPVFEHADAQRA